MSRINVFRAGFARWRQQAGQRRGFGLVPVPAAAGVRPRAIRPCYPLTTTLGLVATATIRIGEFVISPEGDPRILGHPQIRY